MKKRTKISLVLSSAAAILLAGSIMAGGTYALFTSESKTNIVVSSGKVDVTAEITDLHTYTGKDLTGVVSNDESKIKLSTDYTLSEGQFMNGGTASYDIESNTLTLDKMTPGDKVTFNIKLANNDSNVAAKYRTVISCEEDDGLLSGLEFTINGTKFDGLNNKSTWAELTSDFSDTLACVVNLPSNAGNDYQDKLCKISYKIEAVQGNAVTTNTPANTIEIDNAAQLGCFRDKVNKMTTEQQRAAFNGYTIKLTDNIDLNNQEWTPILWNHFKSEYSGSFTATFDGDNYTISNFKVNKLEQRYAGLFSEANYITFKNLNITGAKIEAANGVGALVGVGYGVKIDSCKVTDSTLTASFWKDPDAVDSTNNPDGWNDADKVGAFAGRLDEGGNSITGCTSSGNTIEGYRDVGGLAGFVGNNNTCVVKDNIIKSNVIKNNRQHNYNKWITGDNNYDAYNVRVLVGQVSGFTVGENTIGADGDANIFSIINAE